MKKLLTLAILATMLSCQKEKIQVDAIVINGNVYTVNGTFDKAEAFAIKDGKFLEIASAKILQDKYVADTLIDAQGKTIMPGFIDAHAHFEGLGNNLLSVDLMGSKSFEEVIKRVLDFQQDKESAVIYARGWDQNNFEGKEYPDNVLLNQLYPDTPVALVRVDGHAALFNQAALNLGNVTEKSKIDGGDFVKKDGKLTGVLIDRAQSLVYDNWPATTRSQRVNALLAAQEECFKYGLTTIDDAGVGADGIAIMDSLYKSGDLKIRLYVMASGTADQLDYYLKNGIVKTDGMHIRSFKISSDGALGSRGALLREPYSDAHEVFGLPVTSLDYLEKAANRIANSEFQLNTHAIGDSANHAVLNIYKKALEGKKDRRWRIEHAQIISPEDFKKFGDIMPSIQPTHATSDMYWAEERLGAERMKGAYAYKELLDIYGKVALGTDFPVEKVSPFLTFHSSVARQDVEQFPKDGFQMENALSREETLRGMTIWAAYSNFEENEKGSIEVGKFADFIILDRDIMKVAIQQVPETKVEQTYLGGKPQLK
ncbi:amidohydrolase [Bizionia myxarmorum]|uniref:Amidohydrolase n=1 Tax=Bizionia myxarmorum TaxID=291186 RepID=A0A5D0R8G4_9FLAO|nr:amidohydrolase [Bizionia myxarmorum]TYB76874.1 amidohydrolase [Bizionia myxarmorum]